MNQIVCAALIFLSYEVNPCWAGTLAFFWGGGVLLVAQAGIELKTLYPQYLVLHTAVYHQAWLQYNFIMA